MTTRGHADGYSGRVRFDVNEEFGLWLILVLCGVVLWVSLIGTLLQDHV
jgi:hypothetical protein